MGDQLPSSAERKEVVIWRFGFKICAPRRGTDPG
jgi:hypothetical protein